MIFVRGIVVVRGHFVGFYFQPVMVFGVVFIWSLMSIRASSLQWNAYSRIRSADLIDLYTMLHYLFSALDLAEDT